MQNKYFTKNLGEICEILDNQRKPITKRDREIGHYPYYGATGLQDYVVGYIFDESLVLVGEDGAKWGIGDNSAYKISGKTWVNNHAHVLRPNRDIILDDWLVYFLNIHDLSRFITGTTVKKLNQEKLRSIEIPLPPLDEQRRIVAGLERDLGKIEEAKRLRAKALAATESLLPAELHRIFEEGKAKGWEEKNIGDKKIMSMTSGGTPSRGNKSFYQGNIVWLKSGELQDNIAISDSEEHITDSAIKGSSAKLFPPETVLLAMYGATAGKLGILSIPAATNQAVAGFVCDKDVLYHKFFFYVLMHIRNEIVAKAWGGAQPNLSQTIIKSFTIPLPPLAEQKEIVARVDALAERVATLRARQEASLAELEKLGKSILAKAFE
jgi:type I restriction enzyme S subunit